jgi:hypothetical protein
MAYHKLDNVEYFSYLSNMMTNDARCTCEIKFSIALGKAAFNKKKAVCIGKLNLNLTFILLMWNIW